MGGTISHAVDDAASAVGLPTVQTRNISLGPKDLGYAVSDAGKDLNVPGAKGAQVQYKGKNTKPYQNVASMGSFIAESTQ